MFKDTYGTDYTARYFQMAAKMIEKHCIKYRNVSICLKDMNYNEKFEEQVHLYQMNAANTDKKKITNIDFLVIDGMSIRPNTINKVIADCTALFKRNTKVYLMLISTNNNKV